ncbi:hypothetical protein SLEP1_g9632 [Rubroshorea leprosula]|uniref:Reverse transcriptase Ty1/copia-type domain-containing protein n=1 Tax=Rubroshorea leprosula TaxID=152421 RepID=A0AAV5IDZ7_9ROSI|nr:hypothetical protein SLEP1_g9632 [Rubroshorea leprosula]
MKNKQQTPRSQSIILVAPAIVADLNLEAKLDDGQQSQRVRKRPTWMINYKVLRIEQSGVEELTYFALFSYCDPIACKDVVLESKWRKAMDEEIVAIEKNNTWELTELLKGKKTIDVKWVYKTKLKENGEVDNYKAHLVAKGYKQEFGVDYQEVATSVARHDTIRLVISSVAQNSWPAFQLDVKSTFLHGDLDEQDLLNNLLVMLKLEMNVKSIS